MDKWLKQYKENYEGKSPEAKEVAEYLKPTYNGAMYIPWATMERLTYMQDPNAEFKTVEKDGKIIWTDNFVNENCVENKDGIVNKTTAAVLSHFVKVSCTFLGKTFVEEYPIQEQDYSAAKIYNQNLVNKALKRALAKVASRATGIGLKLYENKDLQYEEKEEEKKPEVKKSTKKVEKVEEVKEVKEEPIVEESVKEELLEPTEIKVEEATSVNATNYSQDLIDTCNFIKNADVEKMTKVLRNLNTSILKQHKFTLNLEDSDDELCEKLSHFENVGTFAKAIQTMLNNLD